MNAETINRKYTKDSPGCWHRMIEYLAELGNTTSTKVVEFKKLDEAKKQFKTSYIHVSIGGQDFMNPHKVMRKGNVPVMEVGYEFKEFPIDVKFDRIWATANKSLEDFITKPQDAGEYKDSLGGRWYSMVSLYKVNDCYFASMECNC